MESGFEPRQSASTVYAFSNDRSTTEGLLPYDGLRLKDGDSEA